MRRLVPSGLISRDQWQTRNTQQSQVKRRKKLSEVFFKRGPRAFRRILPIRMRCGRAHNRLPILTLLSVASVQSTTRIAMHAQSGLASLPILDPAILSRSNSHASAMALACCLHRRGKRVPSSSRRKGSRELTAKSPLCRTGCRPAAFSRRIRA